LESSDQRSVLFMAKVYCRAKLSVIRDALAGHARRTRAHREFMGASRGIPLVLFAFEASRRAYRY